MKAVWRQSESGAEPGQAGGSGWLVRAVCLAGGCGLVYLLVVGSFQFKFKQTHYAHHILMADAMLHGQLHIRTEVLGARWERIVDELGAEPARAWERMISDWALHEDKVYGYWAPLAPVLMVPFVAVFGLDVSDQVINVLFGALNVGLFYWLSCRVDRVGLCRTSESCRVGLVVLLAFGTAHFWLTCTAQVWFAVQIVTLTMVLAALVVMTGSRVGARHCLFGGVFFGAAVLGRNIVLTTGLFFLVLMWLRVRGQSEARVRTWLACDGSFCVPVLVATGLQGAYNYARFGDVFEGGLDIQVRTGGHERFHEAYERYGKFSLHYVPQNVKHYFWSCEFPRLGDGRRWFDLDGNSLFLVTPPMLYVFLAWRRRSGLALAAVLGVVPLLAVLMCYFATGYVQFGPRYLLDALPLLLLLVALGMGGRLTHVGYVLIVLAVAAHMFGTYRLCDTEFAPLRRWVTSFTLPALVALAILARVLAVRLRSSSRRGTPS